MMVAGIGCRKGISVEDVLAALETALEVHGLAMSALSALATVRLKQGEKAILEAGVRLVLPVIVVEDDAVEAVSSTTLSRSRQSLAITGSPSVSEAAALAAAGEGAALLGPRTIVGSVTCAIAEGRI